MSRSVESRSVESRRAPLAQGRYRQHDEARGPFGTEIQRRVAEEWVALNRESAASLLLDRWAARRPALGGLRRPADVVDAVDAGTDEVKDVLLLALVELFQEGQQLAGRIALQAMLPKLASFAFRDSVTGRLRGSPDDRFQLVLGEFWQVLGTYPVTRRPVRVAANLAMDTFGRLRAARTAEIPLDPLTLADAAERGPRPAVAHEPLPGGLTVDCGLEELLAWAIRRGVVSAEEAGLLAGIYADRADAGGTYRDVAEAYRRHAGRTGANAATLRQRAHRARARLIVAARQEVVAG